MHTPKQIKALAAHGMKIKYEGSTYGGTYSSPCPFCKEETGKGGKDRLRILPVQGRSWCNQCPWSGPNVELLMFISDLPREEAREELGIIIPKTTGRAHTANGESVDRKKWTASIEREIHLCSLELFEDGGKGEALKYLHERGLNDDTIQAARLGCNSKNRYPLRKVFGLSEEYNEDTGEPRKIIIPEGILIPFYNEQGECVKAQVRRTHIRNVDDARYHIIKSSSSINMVLLPEGEVKAVIVMESALDAILCHQEQPTDFAFIALGSTSAKVDAQSDALLRNTPYVIIAMDNDDAGIKASEKLKEKYRKAFKFAVPDSRGKDIGEAFQNGLDIAAWCAVGLELAQESEEAAKSEPELRTIKHVRKAIAKASDDEAEVEAPTLEEKSARKPVTKSISNASAKEKEEEVPWSETEMGIFDVEYTLVTSPKKAKAAVEKLQSADLIALDTETTALCEYADWEEAPLSPHLGRIRLVQATDGESLYIFDLDKVPLDVLSPLFAMDWVAHNAVFDYKHLLHAGLETKPGIPNCTMLADNTLSNRNRSLADLIHAHFGITLDKDCQDSDWGAEELSPEQLKYAALDVIGVYRLWEKLVDGINNGKKGKLYHLMRKAQSAVALMENNGLGFDVGEHKKLVKLWKKESKNALGVLHEFAGEELNPRSSSQTAEFLKAHIDKEQLKAWPRTDTGGLSTSAKSLAPFQDFDAVKLLLEYRHWNDLNKMYGEKLAAQINPATGRLHPHFFIAGALTGRMSASGPNVQGFPKDKTFRKLFLPGPGNVFVCADYNQMQLRIVAILSGDAKLLAAYENGQDVHRLTAASVLGKEVEDVTDMERSQAKAIGFGILFGMGAKGLRSYAMSNYRVIMSEAKAKRFRDRFFETYPDVKRWQNQQADMAERTSCSETKMGRVRNFTHEENENGYTASLNTPVQGAEAEVMLATLAYLPDALELLDAKLVNCVHDEILVECPKKNAKAVEKVLRKCMEKGMKKVFPKATMNGLVEVGHGSTWADAK